MRSNGSIASRARRRGTGAAVIGGALVAASLLTAGCSSANRHYDPSKPHHRPDGFTNNYTRAGDRPLSDLLQWWYQRWKHGLPKPPSQLFDGYAGIPLIQTDAAALKANRAPLSVTWIGHATLLIQIGGVNILTDPQFSERAFMVQWAGPKRKVPVPIGVDQLPHIDFVLISHNHYDHLDSNSVLALSRQSAGSPVFMVPLGLDTWFKAQGIERVEAFDWWDSKRSSQPNEVEIHLVPNQHWSRRTLFDTNRTLWGAWVVKAAGRSVYFAGDTGYSKDFADIGARFGGFDLAALPIGAYEPRWFMQQQHINPKEAVQAAIDLRAKRGLAIHWGTFELTDEPLDQPVIDLRAALAESAYPPANFVVLKHGETLNDD